MTDRKTYFEGLYGASNDPYSLKTRWYERRKRATLMSALPAERYRYAFEPGCGAAELTVELAGRCDRVLASDFSDHALMTARQRTSALPNVEVMQQRLPDDWPRAAGDVFDLIVLSEIGYFLDEAALGQVADACKMSLSSDGTLVACDWRPAFAERASPTEKVHEVLGAIGLTRVVLHDEPDFVLQVWCRDPRSVAQHEGIR